MVKARQAARRRADGGAVAVGLETREEGIRGGIADGYGCGGGRRGLGMRSWGRVPSFGRQLAKGAIAIMYVCR